jgi:hypothetical protein
VTDVSRTRAQRPTARAAVLDARAPGLREQERSYRAAVRERPYLFFLGAELLLWACLYAVYFVVRGQTISGPPEALANARAIIDFEQWLGVAHERSFQDAAQAFGAVAWLLSHYYELGFFPLVIACLVYLTRADRERYRELRVTMLLSISVALVVFWLVPTAPPRLVPELGIADTVGMQSHDVGSVYGVSYNPYAAMPSMHVGWSILVAYGIFMVARRRWVRRVALLHPVIMSIAVVTTGNHYLVDGLAGAAIAVPVLLLVRRYRVPSSEREPARAARPLPATQ